MTAPRTEPAREPLRRLSLVGHARPNPISEPDVDEVIANLHLPIADFNAALANSLGHRDQRRVALFKARWLNRAMILVVVTILLLSLSRVAGGSVSMKTGKPSRTQDHKRPAKRTATGKPRSFGQRWISKGDAFTRAVSQTGHWTSTTSKPK